MVEIDFKALSMEIKYKMFSLYRLFSTYHHHFVMHKVGINKDIFNAHVTIKHGRFVIVMFFFPPQLPGCLIRNNMLSVTFQ